MLATRDRVLQSSPAFRSHRTVRTTLLRTIHVSMSIVVSTRPLSHR